jgi:hypothetical protein
MTHLGRPSPAGISFHNAKHIRQFRGWLVIARFGVSRDREDIAGVSRLVADVIEATGNRGE